MEKEIIILLEFIEKFGNDPYYWQFDKDCPFEYIIQNEENCDLERGVIKYQLIFKRKLDNKFFKVNYNQFKYSNNMEDQTAEEVFPYAKTITKYK